MPNNISFSDRLRMERERNGYDLADVSKRLHIRPDILDAIERADFDRMPARGYSKNMIRAYARLLGLDERSVTEQYLDEANAYELGYQKAPRSKSHSGRGSSERRGNRYSNVFEAGAAPGNAGSSRGAAASRSRRGNRDQEARDRRQQSSRGSRDRRTRQPESRRTPISLSTQGRMPSLFGPSGRSDGKVPRSFDTIGSTPPYARRTNDRKGISLDAVNLPLILAIIAALIVVLIVAVIISNSTMQANEDVPSIPISGLTDTSGEEGEPEADGTSSSLKEPDSVKFEFTVERGGETWIEVYEDGSSTPRIAEVVTGPAEESFDVSDTLRFVTANPSVVECKLDGETVELTASGSGTYTYEVDFEEYIDQWREDHGLSTSKSSSSSSTRSSSSRSSSGSSSSRTSSSDSDYEG